MRSTAALGVVRSFVGVFNDNRRRRGAAAGAAASCAGAARGAGQGLQSARARNLRVQEGRAERSGTAARKSTITNAGCATTSWREGGAPKLAGLFKRTTLVTGEPLNDETVKNQIRNGSANMGAYKYALSEADLNDLMSWLHDEKCCWNSDAPPLNPRYKGATAAPAQNALRGAHGRAQGPRQERARRADRRHHGAADLGRRPRSAPPSSATPTDATNFPRSRPAPTRCESPSRRSSIPGLRRRWRSKAPTRSRTSRCCA